MRTEMKIRLTQIARSKLHLQQNQMWVGYLTPVEVVLLVDAGARLLSGGKTIYPWMQEKIRRGESGQFTIWFEDIPDSWNEWMPKVNRKEK